MAVVLQSGNLVWSKVKNALSAANASPAAQSAFADLKAYLAQQKRNPDLQFIPFSAEQAVTAAGVDLTAAACTLYGLWAKGRRTTGTTASFLDVHAAATDAATTTTVWSARFKALGQQISFISADGIAIETGLLVHSGTTVGGTTDSSAADSADGFFIIGAAA